MKENELFIITENNNWENQPLIFKINNYVAMNSIIFTVIKKYNLKFNSLL